MGLNALSDLIDGTIKDDGFLGLLTGIPSRKIFLTLDERGLES